METKADFDKLKAVLIYNIEEVWGTRCETKDTDDFPDLSEVSRCPVCLVYEKFDKFWEVFDATD